MAEAAAQDGKLDAAARLLQEVSTGLAKVTGWWHVDALRAFATHSRLAARVGDIERRDKLRALRLTLAKQNEGGALLAALETKRRIEACEVDSGASSAAERMFQKVEEVKASLGPGHVNVGRLQGWLAQAVSSFPNSTWTRLEEGSTFVLDTVKADTLYQQASELLSVSLGEQHPEVVRARTEHALCVCNVLDKRTEADPLLLLELKASDLCMGVCSPTSLRLLEALAASRLHWAKEDPGR